MQNETCNKHCVSNGRRGIETVRKMGHRGMRGKARQIRDRIHQIDNGTTMTKELEAVLAR